MLRHRCWPVFILKHKYVPPCLYQYEESFRVRTIQDPTTDDLLLYSTALVQIETTQMQLHNLNLQELNL